MGHYCLASARRVTERSETMEIEKNSDGTGSATLRVRGELDLGTVPAFTAALKELVTDDEPASVELDFGDLTFIDSSGIGALIVAARTLHADGRRLVLGERSPTVARVFEMSGIEEAIADLEA